MRKVVIPWCLLQSAHWNIWTSCCELNIILLLPDNLYKRYFPAARLLGNPAVERVRTGLSWAACEISLINVVSYLMVIWINTISGCSDIVVDSIFSTKNIFSVYSKNKNTVATINANPSGLFCSSLTCPSDNTEGNNKLKPSTSQIGNCRGKILGTAIKSYAINGDLFWPWKTILILLWIFQKTRTGYWDGMK